MIVNSNIAVPYKWHFADRLFETGYTKQLVKQAQRAGLECYIDTYALKIRAKNIFLKNIDDIVDAAAQTHVLMTSYILASYIHLSQLTHDIDRVYTVLERAFQKIGRIWMQVSTRFGLLMNKDRLTYLKKISDFRVEKAYGKSFSFDHETTDNGGFVSVVQRCGYHQFFTKNDAPELTSVLCAWDANWADEINPLKHNVTFSRPCTIANGAQTCRFEFLPINAD